MERKKYKSHVPQVSRTPLLIEVRQLHEVCRTTVSTEKNNNKKRNISKFNHSNSRKKLVDENTIHIHMIMCI